MLDQLVAIAFNRPTSVAFSDQLQIGRFLSCEYNRKKLLRMTYLSRYATVHRSRSTTTGGVAGYTRGTHI
jgi:hypothetical protein